MNAPLRRALLQGAREAARLHQKFGMRQRFEVRGGQIDVFGTIVGLELPLLFRPLDGLLGAFLPGPYSGIMVTTARMLSVQRFTGAHELGHFVLGHVGSLDGDEILHRSPFGSERYPVHEVAADAFAAEFLLPRWLLEAHARCQGWNHTSMMHPATVYQMALRCGVSYVATCRALERHQIIDRQVYDKLIKVEPRKIKQELLDDYIPADWHRDVWLLTFCDEGTVIHGGANDLFVVRLKEHSSAGYLWNFDELRTSGFAIVKDQSVLPTADDVGGVVERVLAAQSLQRHAGRLTLREHRPWEAEEEAIARLQITFELLGREEGFSRAERRRLGGHDADRDRL